jgi:hypothetical protein
MIEEEMLQEQMWAEERKMYVENGHEVVRLTILRDRNLLVCLVLA